MQHFKFVNWRIRFLMSRTGYQFMYLFVEICEFDTKVLTSYFCKQFSAIKVGDLLYFDSKCSLDSIFYSAHKMQSSRKVNGNRWALCGLLYTYIYKHIRHTYVCAMSLERQQEHLYNSLASRLLLQLLLMLHQFRLLRLQKTFLICYQSLLQNRSRTRFLEQIQLLVQIQLQGCRSRGAGGGGEINPIYV